jgi:SpoVK/Ycf46/Vps4 family AAA+-type ATPase
VTCAEEDVSDLTQALKPASSVKDLIPSLRRLDALLQHLLADVRARGGVSEAALRGMYVSPQEAEQLLTRGPCTPVMVVPIKFQTSLAVSSGPARTSGLDLLQQAYNLSPFELDLLLIALAPELDLRYERLYGFLQDDSSRRRATVDLALSLRTSTAEDKIAQLAHFSPEAPLVRHGILQLVPDPNQVQPPLLAHYLKPDPQIVAALLGHRELDTRLTTFCSRVDPRTVADNSPLPPEAQQALLALARRATAPRADGCAPASSGPSATCAPQAHRNGLRLQFTGPPGAGKFAAACALAADVGLSVLQANLNRIATGEAGLLLQVLVREAWLKHCVLFIEGVDDLRPDEPVSTYEVLFTALDQHPGITIVAGTHPQCLTREGAATPVHIAFKSPNFAARARAWARSLESLGVTAPESDIRALASRFRLTPAQIGQAAEVAVNRARWRALVTRAQDGVTASDLFASAREQSGLALGRLARKIEPKQTWAEVIVPAEQTAQLREICDYVRLRQRVYGDWGFGRKLSLGKGLVVLFTGPPGTGKTMAAEVIAGELGLDLYRIDLSQVVSKYIGDTEKSLDRLFTAAEGANAILFFDEADSLFGKRSEVKDAHDRYANIEVGYLLQKMEEYEGVAILATNLRQHLDDAFVRRIQSIVEFPFPDVEQRRQIWAVTFPHEAPVGDDVDFGILAREIKLAGGSIKNIALAASFQAARDGGTIQMKHIAHAARREHHKVGRSWDRKQLNGPALAGLGNTDDQ